MLIDLHVHSRFSDGDLTPEEIIPFLKKHGVEAVAVTDHDTVSGIDAARRAGEKHGVVVIPGVELTTYYEGMEIHILGYDMDYTSKKFTRVITNLRTQRFLRIKRMLARLRQEGIDIHDRDVFSETGEGEGFADSTGVSYGRPHIAKALYEKGFVSSFQEAFEHYIGNDCKAYLPKESLPTLEGIRLIKDAGGIAVCAHPENIAEEFIDVFRRNGLDGIEVYCPAHDEMQVYHYEILCGRKDLLATAGSDMHAEWGYAVKIEAFPRHRGFVEKIAEVFPAVGGLL